MLYRLKQTALIMILGAASAVVACPFWPASPATAQAVEISIRFQDLGEYARKESPRARILAEEVKSLRARSDADLQWSNPQIAYEHEEIAPFREWQITIHKSVHTPFARSERKAGWAESVRAAELMFDASTLNLLAELKTGYVRQRLLDVYLEQLEGLKEIVTQASISTDARYREGKMSGVDRHLIQLALLSLDASRRNALQERSEIANEWLSEIGAPPGSDVILETPIAYKPVVLASPEEYIAQIEGRPSVQSHTAREKALEKQSEAARPSLVPGIELYAGYKHIEPIVDGWIAGAALTLPLFDRNAGPARELEARRRIAQNELVLYRTRTAGEIATLVRMIDDFQQMLEIIPVRTGRNTSVMSDLFQSYQDGGHTLDAFLNAIQIEVIGSRDYVDQLGKYYENIFRLEAITGVQIVSFEP